MAPPRSKDEVKYAIDGMFTEDVKKMLKEKGLRVSGLNAVIRERLVTAIMEEQEKTGKASELEPKKERQDDPADNWLNTAFLMVGVWVCFVAFGICSERLTSDGFGEDKEKIDMKSVLIVIQSLACCFISATFLFVFSPPDGKPVELAGGVPPSEWFFAGFAFYLAHVFGYASMSKIGYLLQVIVKSCKSIPVLLGNVVMGNNKLTIKNAATTILLSAGVVMFVINKSTDSKKSNGASDDPKQFAIGCAFVFMALVCDAIYGPSQDKIKKKYDGLQSYHFMFNMNFYQLIFALGPMIYNRSELNNAIDFAGRHPEVYPQVAMFAGSMAAGQLFIYALQNQSGSLVVTQTTTIRKLITVLCSVVWFGKELNPLQWIAIGLVFLAKPVASKLDATFGGDKTGEEKKTK